MAARLASESVDTNGVEQVHDGGDRLARRRGPRPGAEGNRDRAFRGALAPPGAAGQLAQALDEIVGGANPAQRPRQLRQSGRVGLVQGLRRGQGPQGPVPHPLLAREQGQHLLLAAQHLALRQPQAGGAMGSAKSLEQGHAASLEEKRRVVFAVGAGAGMALWRSPPDRLS
jgi:hypothetical protein